MEFVCGLQNIGNTCYLNSIIQILLHNKEISKYLQEKMFEESLIKNMERKFKEVNNDIIQSTFTFQLFNILMNMKEYKIISPTSFKKILSLKNETFSGNRQNDSHELVNFILDTIHEEVKINVTPIYSDFPKEYHIVQKFKKNCIKLINDTSDRNEKLRIINQYYDFEMNHQTEILIHNSTSMWSSYLEHNYSIVSEYFTGLFHSSLRCNTCGYISNSFEIFTNISLEIPKVSENTSLSIYDCLNSFTSEEILDNQNKFTCGRCHNKTSGIKKIMIWYAPDNLIIHFKRFKVMGKNCSKNTTNIVYPKSIDISPYATRKNKSFKYELTSVVHHYGNFSGGHYVSFNVVDNNWIHFNDSSVSKLTGDIDRKIITDETYILIYRRC
jgi:ubiquitin carboxyl-terminal hydrolase 8